MRVVAQLPVAVALCLPAVGLATLALLSGGYYPGPTATAGVVALIALAAWTLFSPHPFAGFGLAGGAVLALLGAYAGWTLWSGSWSHAPGRALTEFDRALLYLTVFALFLLIGRTEVRVRAFVAVLATTCVVIAVVGLAVWLLPEEFPVAEIFERRRMSWPTGYWNTTGLLAALGIVWCLHLASAAREHVVLRVLGAAGAVPLVAVVGYTASRGAAGAAVAGVVVYVLATRTRGVLIGLLATIPGALVAALIVHRNPGIANDLPMGSLIALGRDVAGQLAVLTAGVAALRALLLVLDARLRDVAFPTPGIRVRLGGAAVGLLVVAIVALAAGLPSRASDAYHEFVENDSLTNVPGGTGRFSSFSSDGRLVLWRVALRDGFDPDPLKGSGAGTYATLWDRHRPVAGDVLDVHSLYLETLAELGIVGALLLSAALLAIVAALIRRSLRGGATGAAWAALLGGLVSWLLFAAVDWSFEMPACTLWLFAVGGLALSREAAGASGSGGWSMRPWPLLARGTLAAAAIGAALLPLAVGRSDRRLRSAVSALQRGDCGAAERDANAARDASARRSEPYTVVAYCAARSGRYAAARIAAGRAVARDPRDWESHYTQGLVLAAAGGEPREAMASARRLNPLDRYAARASRLLRGRRAVVRRRARSLPLPLAVRFCGGPTRTADLTSCGNSVLPVLGHPGVEITTRP